MNYFLLMYLRYFPLSFGKLWLSKHVDLSQTKNPLIYQNQFRVTFELDLTEYQMKQMYLHDLYEKNTLKNLLRLCEPTMTAVDVGANIGSYTLSLAQHLNSGKVYAFEPSSTAFQILKKNISLNPFTNIELFPMGLGDTPKTAFLNHHSGHLGSSNLFEKPTPNAESIELTTLDIFCEKNDLNKIDIMKVDIEGGELDFIKGAERTFQKNPKMIVVMEIIPEHCERAGYTANDLFQKMSALGFKGYAPRSWPFTLKRLTHIPDTYFDNVIFLR